MARAARAGGWVLSTAVVAVALSAVVASGHVKLYKKGKILGTSLQYSNVDPAPTDPRLPPPADPIDSFSGKLFRLPGSAPCPLEGREVRVYLKVPNFFPGTSIGTATTAADGSWQLPAEDVTAGEYRARMSKRVHKVTIPPIPGIEQGHKHKYICRGQVSDPVIAGP